MRRFWSVSDSLPRRIFALAIVNLGLVLLVFLVFAHFQYHLEPGSFLFAPAREHLEMVAAEVALDLEQTPVPQRTELMGRYAATYGVDFFLFENNGEQVAGRPVGLPEEVKRQIRVPRRRAEDGKAEGAPPFPRPDPPPPREPPRRVPGSRPPPPPPPPPPLRGRGRAGRPGNREGPVFQMSARDMFWAGVRIPIGDPGAQVPVGGTLVLAAKSFYGTPLFFDFKPWLAALAAVSATFLLCWMPFIRRLTSAISRITRAAEQIEQGDFELQLPNDRSDELGHLSSAINRMAARLAGFVSGQKRFLGDIAHELCAPIARMQFGLGILEQQSAEAQRGAMEDVQEEMRQMSVLVSELLSFSKAGMEKRERVLSAVDVTEIAARAVEREGAEANIRLEIGEPLAAMADREYLLRSLGNLIRNAVRYAGEAGPITVTARRDRKEIVISVLDCGPGLPVEELDRVFTPFYRLEASRSRDHGGVGLGLAIVKSCVEGCRGQVRCRNRQPSGLEMEIRLAAA